MPPVMTSTDFEKITTTQNKRGRRQGLQPNYDTTHYILRHLDISIDLAASRFDWIDRIKYHIITISYDLS